MNEKQPIGDNIKMIEMSEISDENFSAAILKMLEQAITNMLETNEKKIESLRNSKGVESLSKEREDIKMNQMSILEPKIQ